jgi:hypothetical protein
MKLYGLKPNHSIYQRGSFGRTVVNAKAAMLPSGSQNTSD